MRTMWRGMLMAMAAASAGPPLQARKVTPVVGETAPDFQLKLVDGSTVKLSDLRGQVVVLNFWATWCGPCKRELPLLDTYYKAQRDHGLKVYAVTTEDSLPTSELKKLFAVMAIPPAKGVKGPYDIMKAVPTNYVVGRDGRLRYAKAGAFDLDDLNNLLVPLLREPRAPAAAAAQATPTPG